MVIFWTIIILYFIWVLWQSTRPPGIRGRRSGPVFVPGPGWDSGRDSWSSGGGGFSGGGGGGFSGGGGSFGGGGASGGW
jgi:uncharacterized protein